MAASALPRTLRHYYVLSPTYRPVQQLPCCSALFATFAAALAQLDATLSRLTMLPFKTAVTSQTQARVSALMSGSHLVLSEQLRLLQDEIALLRTSCRDALAEADAAGLVRAPKMPIDDVFLLRFLLSNGRTAATAADNLSSCIRWRIQNKEKIAAIHNGVPFKGTCAQRKYHHYEPAASSIVSHCFFLSLSHETLSTRTQFRKERFLTDIFFVIGPEGYGPPPHWDKLKPFMCAGVHGALKDGSPIVIVRAGISNIAGTLLLLLSLSIE